MKKEWFSIPKGNNMNIVWSFLYFLLFAPFFYYFEPFDASGLIMLPFACFIISLSIHKPLKWAISSAIIVLFSAIILFTFLPCSGPFCSNQLFENFLIASFFSVIVFGKAALVFIIGGYVMRAYYNVEDKKLKKSILIWTPIIFLVLTIFNYIF